MKTIRLRHCLAKLLSAGTRSVSHLFLLIAGIIALTCVCPLRAQSPRLYSTAQGLVNTRVTNLAFDTENFLWVSTEMGLARFDGRTFTTYFANDDDPYALHSSSVNCVFEDPAGRHWVGSTDGLYYFCRTENKFTHYDLSTDSSFTISISAIMAHPTRPNYLLVATHGYGVYAFDAESRQIDEEMTVRISVCLDKYNLWAMTVDSHKHLWALLRESVNVVDMTDAPTRVQAVMSPDVEASLMHSASYAIVEDPDRTHVYIGGERGLFVADPQTLQITRVASASGLNIRALHFDVHGDLLIGTEGSGLYLYKPGTGELSSMTFANLPVNLTNSKIHSIEIDAQQNLWLGLFQQGVMIVPAQSDLFRYYPVSNVPGNANLGCVSCFVSLTPTRSLVGTDGAGVVEYDDHKYRIYNSDNSPLESNAIISMVSTAPDVAYVGTYNAGLYRWHDGTLSRPQALESLSRASIMCQAYDATSGILYLGTNGHGIYGYNTRTEQLRPVAAGACNAWIVSLALDEGRALWVGTESHAFRIDLEHEVAQMLDGEIRQKMRLQSIVPDTACVWLGGNKGLWRYDRRTGHLSAVRSGNVRSGAVIIAMTRGRDGNLWMSTNYGISSYNASTEELLNYTGDEISLIGSFCERSVGPWADGRIVFGGDNGLLLFSPERVSGYNGPLREVYFSQLWVNNVPTDYNPGAEHNVLDASLWHARRLTLSPDANSFTISFAVQEYDHPSALRYAYRLEGYDNQWHELPYSGANTVNFSHLPWGTYRLQVRAFIHEGQDSPVSYKELTVTVLKPWYAQWWAWLIYIAILAAAVWTAVGHFRDRAHQRRLLMRTEHAQQIKEAKLQLFTSISHEIKTPLTLILSPLRTLMDKKVDNATASVYELMYRNAMRILMLVNQQMDVRKIDHGKLKLKMRQLGLRPFLTGIMDYYNNAAMSHQIRYNLEMPNQLDELKVWGDPDQLDKVFFNLLSNAFKFTPNRGEVRITVRRLQNAGRISNPQIEEVVEVAVFNSGSKLSTDDIEHIFERFYQGHAPVENAGSGIGLSLAYELTQLHHGTITARNRNVDGDCDGVEFRVYLPLGNDHLSPEEMAPADAIESADQSANQISDLIPTLRAVLSAEVGSTQEEADPHEMENEDDAAPRGPVTVMLVDDDPAFLDYLRRELREYKVVTAASGNEAWGQLLVQCPDVVITDVKMAGGDGYELCRRIKHNIDTDNIPVIVLTSDNTSESAQQAMDCEADRYLNKPVNVTLLRGAIEQSLKVRRNILSKARRTDFGFEYNQVQMESADDKLMQHVMESIRKHISDVDFNVEQLSRDVGISRVHLNRKMKELLGTSPSTLIRSVRLKQAAFLLIDNDVTVSEIAYSVGFSSPSYFTSNFTNYFGMTPKAFVQNYLKNPNDEKLKKLLE